MSDHKASAENVRRNRLRDRIQYEVFNQKNGFINDGCFSPSNRLLDATVKVVEEELGPLILHELTFSRLRRENYPRCSEAFGHTVEEYSPNDWVARIAEELGELARCSRKIRAGLMTVDEARANAGEELADLVIIADLIAAWFGLDLGEEVRRKFNAVSAKKNSDRRL